MRLFETRSKMRRVAAAVACAAALALGVPAAAQAQEGLTDVQDRESAPASYVIARPQADGALADEPVVAELDGTYLLGFGTAREASRAAARLADVCEFAEADRVVSAAEDAGVGNDADDAGDDAGLQPAPDYMEGGDPFTLAGLAAQDAAAQSQGSAPLVALVDSGAPESSAVVGAASLVDGGQADETGHAAAMLAEILDQSPDAKVYALRVLDAENRGTIAALYAGIVAAADAGADVINLSLAAPAAEGSDALAEAVQRARAAGAVVVAAAGNDGADAAGYLPAGLDGVTTAGACDASGARVKSSNFGDAVDVWVARESTSRAAAAASGWIAAHVGSEGGLRNIADAVDGKTFFAAAGQTEAGAGADEPDPGAADDENGKGEDSKGSVEQLQDRVVRAMEAIGSITQTELRPDYVNKQTSPLQASQIRLDDGGKFVLKDAEFSTTNSKIEKHGLYTRANASTLVDHYGVVVPNPCYNTSWSDESKGEEKNVSGSFTLTFRNAGQDRDGNRVDLAMTVSNIKVNAFGVQAHKCSTITILRGDDYDFTGSKLHYLNLAATASMGTSSAFPKDASGKYPLAKVGVECRVDVQFLKAGTSTPASGNYLMLFNDIDQPNKCVPPGSSNAFGAPYSEQVRLREFSGVPDTWQDAAYVQNDSLLKTDAADGAFVAGRSWDDDASYLAAFVAATNGPRFSYLWGGSDCSTALFTEYPGITIRDKNTAGPESDAGQGVVTKNVDNAGAFAPSGATVRESEPYVAGTPAREGGKRTDGSWRSTSAGWKQGTSAAPIRYSITAKDGYRVTKVELVAKASSSAQETKSIFDETAQGAKTPTGLITLEFYDGAPNNGNAYATNRDYDIVVTTAKVASASVDLPFAKSMVGFPRPMAGGEYLFDLFDEAGKRLATQVNGADGKVVFQASRVDGLNYAYSAGMKSPQTYTYTVAEQLPEGATAENGYKSGQVTYDGAVRTVRVTVEVEREDGIDVGLKATPELLEGNSYKPFDEAASRTFTNVYSDPRCGVKAKKIDAATGEPLAGATFQVKCTEGKQVGQTWQITTGSDGVAFLDPDGQEEACKIGSFEVTEIASPDNRKWKVNESWKKTFEVTEETSDKHVFDFTDDPCADDKMIALPQTGRDGIAATLAAGLALTSAGGALALRRRKKQQ